MAEQKIIETLPNSEEEEFAQATQDLLSGDVDNKLLPEEEIPEDKLPSTEEIPDYSSTEKEAMSKGWRPKDQFPGSENKKFISAEEFLDRGEFLDKIKHLSQSNKQLQSTVRELVDANKRQQEMIGKEKADYYLQQKRSAIESGNIEDAEKFEKAYYESQIPFVSQQQSQERQSLHPAVEDFKSRNVGWFNNDTRENESMTDFAIKSENYYLKNNSDWSYERVLTEVERSVKDRYPHRFTNVNRDLPSRVSTSNPSSVTGKSASSKISFNRLPAAYKSHVRAMVGCYTDDDVPAAERTKRLDDYAKQLYDMGVIKDE